MSSFGGGKEYFFRLGKFGVARSTFSDSGNSGARSTFSDSGILLEGAGGGGGG